jgi:hypothetical protein
LNAFISPFHEGLRPGDPRTPSGGFVGRLDYGIIKKWMVAKVNLTAADEKDETF